MDKITFITGNAAKAEQVSRQIDLELEYKKLDLQEIQSLDLNEVVIQKAKDAYALVQEPVLVEDVSLRYHALGKLPGPLIRWFLEELGNAGLCRLINHYNKDRSATASIAYCLYDGEKSEIFSAEVEGKIAAHPRGEGGFGWDPVFIPEGSKQTWAEVTDPNLGSAGMRKIALDKMATWLREND